MQNNFCEHTNDKRQLVFLHGYLSSGKSFFHQIKFFEKYFEVFAPDLKGFGENVGMDWAYSLDDYILEVEEFKYKNGITCPHLIAHSFGGRIALKATAKNNAFCSRLVLTGSAGLKTKPTLKKILKKTAFGVLKNFVDREKLTAFYSKDYIGLSPIMKDSFKLIVNETLDYTLDKIMNKTLIVFGKNDRETPVYLAKRLNKNIVNSRLTLIEDAGHFCFIDKVNTFNYAVREFLLE